jgi:hypothetical protein
MCKSYMGVYQSTMYNTEWLFKQHNAPEIIQSPKIRSIDDQIVDMYDIRHNTSKLF